MDRREIDALKERVSCVVVLARARFALDRLESTRRHLGFRRGSDVVIVVHDGRGWWDPHSEAKGDVFRLLDHLERLPFPRALERVQDLAGRPPADIRPAIRMPRPGSSAGVAERWAARRRLWRGASGWHYLAGDRRIPQGIIAAAVAQDLLRQGPWGSVWMRHVDQTGQIAGWEERGRAWRGYSTGGHKCLFAFGARSAPRVCVTEAAIDALSLAALEEQRPDTLYVSTGGG